MYLMSKGPRGQKPEDEDEPEVARYLRVLFWVAFSGWLVAMVLQCGYSGTGVL